MDENNSNAMSTLEDDEMALLSTLPLEEADIGVLLSLLSLIPAENKNTAMDYIFGLFKDRQFVDIGKPVIEEGSDISENMDLDSSYMSSLNDPKVSERYLRTLLNGGRS